MRMRIHGALLLGQLLALLIATTATCSTVLAGRAASFPTLQSSANYLLLGLVFGGIQWRKRQPLSNPWWTYLLLAALDVEANFCVVAAFRWTSLTSVTLLDSFSIPVAVALSALVLGAQYRRQHYAGSATCVLGLGVLVLLGDRHGNDPGAGGGSNPGGGASASPAIGDCLVLLGASLYAACNVAQERLLGDTSPDEVLAMLGAFGFVLSLAQGLPLELGTLAGARWSAGVAAALLGYTLAMFLFYALVPHMLMLGGAALLNLSLLSSDVWAAGARALFFGGFPGLTGIWFAISFALVALGLALFTRGGEVSNLVEEAKLQLPTTAAGRGGRPAAAYAPVPGAAPPLPPLVTRGSGPEEGIELEAEEAPLAPLASTRQGAAGGGVDEAVAGRSSAVESAMARHHCQRLGAGSHR